MIVVMNGREIELKSIDSNIDACFIDLYKAYFDNGTINLDKFNNQANLFFDSHKENYEVHDDFFNNFTILWRNFISMRDYGTGELVWERCVDLAHKWEEKTLTHRIHKGTPFYFWGMTAILRGDLDKGYALMHKALQEDILTQGNITPNSPSFSFVIADYSNKYQAFGDWPRKQAQYISEKINSYNAKFNRTFSLNSFWNKVIHSDLEKSVIYQFTLYISKLYDRQRKPQYIYEGEFASQLLLDLLFNISLVIDSVIKTKNPSEYRFRDHIMFVKKSSNLLFSDQILNDLNGSFIKDFDQTLKDLIIDIYKISDDEFLSGISSAYAITYGIRNHGAHNVTSAPTIWESFSDIEVSVFSMLFNVIENVF